jgi:hypothetical protein
VIRRYLATVLASPKKAIGQLIEKRSLLYTSDRIEHI